MTSARWQLRCHDCGAAGADGDYRCPACGGALAVRYAAPSSQPDDRATGVWRFADRLPVGGKTPRISLGEGGVPLVQLDRLSDRLGAAVSAKLEALNPTGTFKDRAMAVGIAKAVEHGVATVALASAGNAGASCAAYAARAGLDCVVLVPEATPPERLVQVRIAGARLVRVEGSTREAAALLDIAKERYGWRLLTTAAPVNPYQAEGIRTIGYELAEQWDAPPDWLVVPVGGGGMLSGTWNALADLAEQGRLPRLPRLLAVQAAGCAPVVDAFARGLAPEAIEPWGRPTSIVASLADPVPFDGRTALAAIRASGGAALALDDEPILAAQRELAATEGLFVEPAAATAFAGLRAALASGLVAAGSRVTLVLSGSGFKDIAAASRGMAEPPTIPPDLAALEAAMR
jgi:threonine synthase